MPQKDHAIEMRPTAINLIVYPVGLGPEQNRRHANKPQFMLARDPQHPIEVLTAGKAVIEQSDTPAGSAPYKDRPDLRKVPAEHFPNKGVSFAWMLFGPRIADRL